MSRSAPTKLWVVSYVFFPVWAGPAERFLRYSPGLRQRDVDMTLVTCMRPGQPVQERKNGTLVERIGAQKKNVHGINRFYLDVARHLLKAKDKPDVIVFLSVTPVLFPLLLILKGMGIRTIFVHSMASLTDYSGPLSFKERIIKKLKFSVYNAFDSLVCSTKALSGDLVQLGLPARKIHVIPNGVLLERFKPVETPQEKAAIRKDLDLPHDGPIALFAGLRTRRKGVLELVRAWQEYKRNSGAGWLVLVGQDADRNVEFDGDFFEAWDHCRNSIVASDQIIILPPSKEIELYFKASDLFVFLSNLEGMPNVIPESMATGLPVLTTKFKGFSDDFGREGIELVTVKRDPIAISRSIQSLLSDSVQLEGLSINGRKWVEAHQSIDVVLDSYSDLFKAAKL